MIEKEIFKFTKLIEDMETLSTKIIKNSGKILQLIKTTKTNTNLIPKIINNCNDSLIVNGCAYNFVQCILTNDFSTTSIFLKELWFGDLYGITGILALQDFIYSLEENFEFTKQKMNLFDEEKKEGLESEKESNDEIEELKPEIEENNKLNSSKLLELY